MKEKIYLTAGYNTISLGTGRKEFNPKKERPGIEHYISEAGKAVLEQIGGADKVDEVVMSNFNASGYNNQANIPGFAPMIDEKLRFKSATRVEGACGSGGIAMVTSFKFLMSGMSDVIMALGFEVQNSMKAVYGADVLAQAGWAKDRKAGHAHFFPGQFSDRAGVYFEKYGREYARKGFARWYRNAIENARLCPTAQEYHNTTKDLEKAAMREPNPKVFVENLTVLDCSKVSDAASAIAVMTEEGLKRCGVDKKDAVEVVGFGHAEEDITKPPVDPVRLTTTEAAVKKALEMANLTMDDIGTIEAHDCFTVAGILAVETLGLAEPGKGAQFVYEGNTARDGKIPINTTGGLIGWGHPVGATGVHQAVTIWEQLTGKAGDAQIEIKPERPYGMTINMGGDDKSVVCVIYKRAE